MISELKKLIRENNQPKAEPQAGPAAAPPYTVSGEIRFRGELDGRSFVPGTRTLGYSLLRSRVNLQVSPTEDTRILVQVQDSRVFGAGNPTMNRGTQDGMSKAIDFHQAYFSVAGLFSESFSAKIGRQELVYGKQRLLSNSNWNNVGTTFDAAVVQWDPGPFTADLIISKLVGSQTTTLAENLRGLYVVTAINQQHKADLFVLQDDNTVPLTRGPAAGQSKLNRITGGVNLYSRGPEWDYNAELILQRGRISVVDSLARASIDAFLYSIAGGYTFDPESKLRLGFLYTILSGDDRPKDETSRTFVSLFASTHTYFGYMDFFPKTLPDYGLRDLALSVSANIGTSTSLATDLHYFSLDRGMTVAATSGENVSERSLGYELDITATHKYSSSVSLNGGIGVFVPEGAMRCAKDCATSYWAYLMTTVSF
jgi:hypothetical protein